MLKSNTKLTMLDISKNNIQDFNSLFESLNKSSIQDLNLEGNNPKDLNSIDKLLKSKKLKKLNLSCINAMNDEILKKVFLFVYLLNIDWKFNCWIKRVDNDE